MVEAINLPVMDFQTALLQIDRIGAAEIFKSVYLKTGSFETLEHLIMETLERIGVGWEDGQLSLSQVYMSGVICEELMENHRPKVVSTDKKNPKIAIAVLQDHHALGKRIVCSVLSAAGYDYVDIGHGLSVEEIVNKTIEGEIDILLISTLMLASALKVKTVVESLRKNGSSVKVVAGGAPFRLDSSLWLKVNADADGKNGTHVIYIIEKLAKEGRSS